MNARDECHGILYAILLYAGKGGDVRKAGKSRTIHHNQKYEWTLN